ncbi:MAG: VOC family protein [Synergistaceae bacterium]|jgi:lactoylglutathione lyase|nr:VOC family protein [Synergistaceae bacterium]
MKSKFLHSNINVTDIDRSINFYGQALGLKETRRKRGKNFTIVFLGDGQTGHQLELTCLDEHGQPYDLGENESHIAFGVDDFGEAHALHSDMGCICYENHEMGIYFIEDPDGYWMEIIPPRPGENR